MAEPQTLEARCARWPCGQRAAVICAGCREAVCARCARLAWDAAAGVLCVACVARSLLGRAARGRPEHRPARRAS